MKYDNLKCLTQWQLVINSVNSYFLTIYSLSFNFLSKISMLNTNVRKIIKIYDYLSKVILKKS